MAADGIFIKILPQLELAALAAVLSQLKALFGKAGNEMSDMASRQAAEISRLTDIQIADANRAAKARMAADKAAGDVAVAEAKRVQTAWEIGPASPKRIAAENAEAAAIARRNQLTTEREQADARAAKSLEAVNAANAGVAASSLAAGKAFNMMGAGAAVVTGVIGVSAVEAAKKYEFGLASLQAKTDQTAGSMKTLHDGLLQVSTQTGASLEELTKASTLVAKAGPNFQDAANNLKLVSAAAQLAAIEGTGLENSMQAILFTMKDFSFGTNEAVKVASMLRSGAKDASVSIDELAGSLHNVEPVMKILTQGDPAKGPIMFSQMMALVAQGTQGGTSADQTTDLVNNTVTNLITGSGNARAMYGAISGGSYEDLQKQLTTEGPIGIMQHMYDLVQSRIIRDPKDENYGRVKISSTYNNLDQQKTLKRYYDTLSPEMQDVANRVDAGTLAPEDLRNATREGPENARFRAWYTQRNKVQAFNPVAQKYGSDYITPEQVILGLTNNQSGMKIMSQDFGTADARANLAQTQKDTLGAQGERGGADVSGWAKVAETLKVQLDQMKRAMTDAAISIGESMLPALKGFVEGLTVLFDFFNKHQTILHGLVDVIALMAGRWIVLKTAMAFDGVFSSLGSGFLGLGGKMGGAAKEANNVAKEAGNAAKGIGSMLGPMAMLGVLAYDFLDMYGKAHPFKDNPDYSPDVRDAYNRGNDERKGEIVGQLQGRALGGFAGKGGSGYPGGLGDYEPPTSNHNRPFGDPNWKRDKPSVIGIPPVVPPSFPVDDGGGYTPAGAGLTANTPDGTLNNPVTVTIPGLESTLSSMATGGTGGGGIGDTSSGFTGSLPEGVTNPLQAAFSGKGGFVGHIVQFFTGFLAELALGNPLGQLMARGQDGAGGDSGIDTSQIGDLSKMTASERKKLEYQLKLQEATRTAENAQRNYVDALSKFGPRDKRTANALNSWLNAKDNLDGILLSQQDAAQQAVEKWIEANAQLQKDLPGSAKYNKDKAIADKLAGQIPAGATATDADGNPIALPGSPGSDSPNPVIASGAKFDPAFTPQAAANNAKIYAAQQDYWNNNPPASGGDTGPIAGTGSGRGKPRGLRSSTGDAGGGGTMPGASVTYTPDWMIQHGFAPLYERNAGNGQGATNIPQQIKDLASQFGLTVNSHADTTLHGGNRGKGNTIDPMGGWGFDFYGMPGDPQGEAKMQALAAYEMQPGNIGNIAQLIHRGGGKDWGVAGGQDVSGPIGQAAYYNTGQGYNVHGDHDHIAFATMPGMPGGSDVPQNLGRGRGKPMGLKQAPISGDPAGAGSPAVSNNTAATVDPGTGGGLDLTASPVIQGAIQAGGMALDALMPGAGQLGTVGLKEANRFAQYLSQVAGIGVEGITETFGVHDPDGGSAGGKGGWLNKIAGGLSGAKKQSDNTAGNAATNTAPQVKPDEPHVGDGKSSPGEMNINQTNNIHGVPDADGATKAINQGLTQFPMLFNH